MIHSQINICNEIEGISKKYSIFLDMEAFHAMNKNKEIVTLLNVHFKSLKKIFNKYAIRKDNTEPMEMTAEKFYNFFTDVSNMCKYDIIKLNKGDVKTDYNIDIFDFLRKIVGMALNLTEKPEKDEEDNNNTEEKRDLEYIGLSQEEAVEKFIEDIIQKYKEKDLKEKKK